ncbi:MAG: hypothetical protein EFT35_05080 [Methanophagales archaeon ANME-1-THS]|nr:MAG: hypothetical protein EFT35_05080 [Methanophagales archaeon ANME-1-THS]
MTVRDYLNSLERYLTSIKSTKELKEHILDNNSASYLKGLRNLLNFMDYQELDTINGTPIERWRSSIKLKKSNARMIYLSDEEVQEAYQHMDEDVKILFLAVAYSGARLTQLLEGLEHLGESIILGDIARFPLESKGSKKGFWCYIPSSLLSDLRKYKSEGYDTVKKKLKYGRVTGATLRKWNLNFLISHGVQESIADFIQSRVAKSVAASHYMNLLAQGDREYTRICEELCSVINDGKKM